MFRKSTFLILLAIVAFSATGIALDNENYIGKIAAQQKIVSKDIVAELYKSDLSGLWTKTPSSAIFGFIGSNYQRLQIHYLYVKRDSKDKALYHVTGKDRVLGKVFDFTGSFRLLHAYDIAFPEKETKGNKPGYLIGKYILSENNNTAGTGIFKGEFITYWYRDKTGQIRYDDIMSGADDDCNNLFVGDWTDYKTKKSKKCNWGDWRIPDCGDLDVGAGEFGPDEKYAKYGWENYQNAYYFSDKNTEAARRIEKEEWWK